MIILSKTQIGNVSGGDKCWCQNYSAADDNAGKWVRTQTIVGGNVESYGWEGWNYRPGRVQILWYDPDLTLRQCINKCCKEIKSLYWEWGIEQRGSCL